MIGLINLWSDGGSPFQRLELLDSHLNPSGISFHPDQFTGWIEQTVHPNDGRRAVNNTMKMVAKIMTGFDFTELKSSQKNNPANGKKQSKNFEQAIIEHRVCGLC
ncbi:MAG: hypothetical protein AAF731_04805 [Bacteroidota bacterium]